MLSQAKRRGWHLECSGNAPEPGGIDIGTQFDPCNFGGGETAGQGEVLDTVSHGLTRLPDSGTYIDAASARDDVQAAHSICLEMTPSVMRQERALLS